jgi:hypothetical protein
VVNSGGSGQGSACGLAGRGCRTIAVKAGLFGAGDRREVHQIGICPPIIVSSIIKKRRGGYLYAATSARVEGQPRIVEQVYLGTEDEVIARLIAAPGEDPGLPETAHRKFGTSRRCGGCLRGSTRST